MIVASALLEAKKPIDPRKFIMQTRERRGHGVTIDDDLVITEVRSAKGEYGVPTGSTRPCRMEGCMGASFAVRWPDNKITWLCTRGLEYKGTTAIIPA